MNKLIWILGLFFNVIFYQSPEKQTPGKHNFSQTSETYGLDSTQLELKVVAGQRNVPWELVWGPDNWIWFTEQDGKVSRLNPKSGEIREVLQLDDYYRKRLGLMSMALHPDWKSNPHVFINYSHLKEDSSIVSKLVRYTYDGKRLIKPLLLKEIPGYLGHNGSRLVIGKDRKLLWATGDLKKKEGVLDPAFANGKVLRLNLDGSIPSDNPFPGSPVWAMGFRVPQGLALTPKGNLFIAEHGDATDDEVNLITRAGHYGWPEIAGNPDQPAEASYARAHHTTTPLKTWTPTIAPAGMDYYNGNAIPEWGNALLLTTLKDQSLRVLKLDPAGAKIVEEEIHFQNQYGRLRDICVSPDGDIYVSTSNRDWNPPAHFPVAADDKIIRISAIGKMTKMQRSERAAKVASSEKATLYAQFCESCHKKDGKGLEGEFPSLVGSTKVAGDQNDLLKILLHGSASKSAQQMPSFAFLDNAQISSVANYVRANFAHVPARVSPEDVMKMRSEMPGTAPLIFDKDLSYTLLDEAHRFVEKKIVESGQKRGQYWNRNFTSRNAYEASVEPNRKRFRKALGIDEKGLENTNYNLGLPDRRSDVGMERFAYYRDSVLVAETSKYRVYQVRWPVLNRISGEGLLLEPKGKATATVIAVPDADQTPEQLAGLAEGIAPHSQFARHLAENGMRVLVPTVIDRSPVFPGEPKEQTKREWLYRQSYHMGKHLIGFEVQKVSAVVDWIEHTYGADENIGVAGYLEGGLIAFYAAAVDPRIDVTLVSGYFQSRENVWDEPIYRNVWGLLREFGDAEIASLIAPRPFVVEYSGIPEIWDGKKPDSASLYKYSAYKGHLKTPDFENVDNEFKRIDKLLKPNFQFRELVSNGTNRPAEFGSKEALAVFCKKLGKANFLAMSGEIPKDSRNSFKPADRQYRQAKEIDDHVQWLLRVSDYERNNFFLYKVIPEIGTRTWSTKSYHPYYPVGSFVEKSKPFRTIFQKEIIGEFDDKLTDPEPQTRKIYDTVKWTGYEVVLKVFDGLSTAGILLIPKDIRPDEKRPVVVLQHGRNGVPSTVIEGNTSYNDIGARLADQGFVVFAPFGIYNGEDRYRWLGRKANTLQKTMFSFVLAQHRQILSWLPTLPYVDKNRIAFYGKSYGGEMAMRIPSILEGYCLSVCSGDFGDWSRKVTDTYWHNSFMNTIEWEMPYFNMGSTFSYAEMAYLIAPRPFMVERGHDDLVQPDEWVAYEYAKVKYLYDQLNLGDKTEIEYFNGGHASRNEGIFKFLHKHLNWP